MRAEEGGGGGGAAEGGRRDGECAHHDAILIGGDEVFLGEDEFVQETVLVDCCLAISDQDLEDIPSYQCYYFGSGCDLPDGYLLAGQDLLLDDGPPADSELM